jgi:hypothetical protein
MPKKIEPDEEEQEEEEEPEVPVPTPIKKVKKEQEPKILVLPELPKQDVREMASEDGTVYRVLTIDEALTEALNILKRLDKAI